MEAERKSAADLYGAHYFGTYGGTPYERSEHWLTFFGRIADKIVQDIRPRTVLDAGCAMGFLVEALRDRGIEAYGIDVSEYALGQVREDIRPWCRVASVTDPIDRNYDLITCIEVLEHLQPEDATAALDNLCAHTSDFLFSSTPNDFAEATHFNVRPPEFWAEELLARGFLRDVDLDASLVTEWAGRFRKGMSLESTIARYEHHLVRLAQEGRAVREALIAQLARREEAEARWQAAEARCQEAEEGRLALSNSKTFRYSRPVRSAYAGIERLLRRGPTRSAATGNQGVVFAAEIDSAVTADECRILAQLADGKRVLELGSWFGRSTIAMATVAERIDAVDPHCFGPPGREDTLTPFLASMERYGVRDRVTVHTSTSTEVVPTLPSDYDVVFIDADHNEPAVREDLHVVLPHIVPRGVIAFHDYGEKGTVHFDGKWYPWGVTEVVDEFAAELGVEVSVTGRLAVVRLPERASGGSKFAR